jgi:hypothetical protein
MPESTSTATGRIEGQREHSSSTFRWQRQPLQPQLTERLVITAIAAERALFLSNANGGEHGIGDAEDHGGAPRRVHQGQRRNFQGHSQQSDANASRFISRASMEGTARPVTVLEA